MTTMKMVCRSLLICLCCSSITLWAITLDEAKAKGYVGEKASGYLGIPDGIKPSDEVLDLVKKVNKARKGKYTEIALKNKLQPSEVGKLAYEKAIKRSKHGHMYQNLKGKWVRKLIK